MTDIQIFSGLIILVLMVIKPFLYKPAAEHFPAELSSVFTSVWLVAAIALTLPFLGHDFIEQMPGVFFVAILFCQHLERRFVMVVH